MGRVAGKNKSLLKGKTRKHIWTSPKCTWEKETKVEIKTRIELFGFQENAPQSLNLPSPLEAHSEAWWWGNMVVAVWEYSSSAVCETGKTKKE